MNSSGRVESFKKHKYRRFEIQIIQLLHSGDTERKILWKYLGTVDAQPIFPRISTSFPTLAYSIVTINTLGPLKVHMNARKVDHKHISV